MVDKVDQGPVFDSRGKVVRIFAFFGRNLDYVVHVKNTIDF